MYVVPKRIMDMTSNKPPKLLAKVWKIVEAIPITIICMERKKQNLFVFVLSTSAIPKIINIKFVKALTGSPQKPANCLSQ